MSSTLAAPSQPAALDRALRRVATAVAANGDPAEVFELVADAVLDLLAVDSGRQFDPVVVAALETVLA